MACRGFAVLRVANRSFTKLGLVCCMARSAEACSSRSRRSCRSSRPWRSSNALASSGRRDAAHELRVVGVGRDLGQVHEPLLARAGAPQSDAERGWDCPPARWWRSLAGASGSRYLHRRVPNGPGVPLVSHVSRVSTCPARGVVDCTPATPSVCQKGRSGRHTRFRPAPAG
jgi:hypothetical protein